MSPLTQAEAILWIRKAIWTIDEAAILIAGISPQRFIDLQERNESGRYIDEAHYNSGTLALKNMKDAAIPIMDVLKLGDANPKSPAQWITDAKKLGLDACKILHDAKRIPTPKSPDDKPWLTKDPADPEPEQPWYTPARHFARQCVKDDSTLLVKKDLLAKKVVIYLSNAGYLKRGRKEPFKKGTVLKSFTKVNLG